MRVSFKQALIGVAAMLVLVATHASAQFANTVAISGSSGLYNEIGQTSYAETNGGSQGCAWTTGTKIFTLNDSRFTEAVSDTATAWITWSPTGTSCTTPNISSTNPVTIYLSTDSTVGNRCFFANPRCTITTTATANSAGANALPGVSDTPLPSAVLTAVSGAPENVVATDIRPEDAKFATLRALTSCGTPVVSGSQYLGIGFTNGSSIKGSTHQSNGSGGGFNVGDFNLMGTDPFTGNALSGNFVVTPVGAVPVVVVVNPTDTTGFGSLLVSNVDRAVLAGYLDGTYGATSDLIPQTYTSGGAGSTVYLREFLSGTYNTMEYAIPNSVQNQSSQEVGLASLNAFNNGNTFPPFNCDTTGQSPSQGAGGAFTLAPGATGTANPLDESYIRLSSVTSYRERAIGTGNELKAQQATSNSLGYAFWSAANFAGATAANSKYLTVDGIDPIQEIWSDGLVPTSGNDLLGNVSLSHIKDGSYPIWSILRLVSDPTGIGYTTAVALAKDAGKFLSPSQPDFVPLSQLAIVRSHFAPPGVNFPSSGTNVPANGTGSLGEAGGDVAGLVYTIQSDGSYNADNSVKTGNTGHRQ